jgi:lauroyl/myristoyl acyltransferase
LFAPGAAAAWVLLTPHYESFCLGIAFLGRTGGVVNSMSSSVTQDPRVDPAVRRHFDDKYRGLETYLNGGRVIDMESGLRPFYRMLEQHETLVVLADAPVLPGGAAMSVNFLGGRRTLAAGAVRLAQRTGSDLGGFICAPTANGRYELTLCEPGPSNDPATIDRVYSFMSAAIMANPGGWWAADLLPFMPLTEPVA